jgi:predicted Ser/Thr protein kinase
MLKNLETNKFMRKQTYETNECFQVIKGKCSWVFICYFKKICKVNKGNFGKNNQYYW